MIIFGSTMTSFDKELKESLLAKTLDILSAKIEVVLFIQTEGAFLLPNSTALVLFIQIEGVAGCFHNAIYPNWRCVGEVKNLSVFLKGLRGFRVEWEIAQGKFMCCVQVRWMLHIVFYL